ANGNVSRTYTYGHMLVNQSQLISDTWTLSFYGLDGHGSVRFLMDSSGGVTDTYDYDGSGILIHQTGLTPNLYLYSAQQFDPDLGLYSQRARYLNVSTGRFWTMDSFEGQGQDPMSLHKYLYGKADPVDRSDPTGRYSIFETGAVAAIIPILAVIDAGLLFGIYARGVGKQDGQEQLPDESKAVVNTHDAYVYQSQRSADEVLSYLATFAGINHGSVATVSGVPVTSVGQDITFFLKGPLGIFGIGQRYFSVR